MSSDRIQAALTRTCTCSDCSRGLWCTDGKLGVFEGDSCKLCSRLAWQHWTVKPCGAKL